MIVSVSRRTDIPAFYSEWFYKRIEAGFVHVINPMNTKQVSKIALDPEHVDCFVFWTKDARPMTKDIDKLDKFNYYFQYTITGYGPEVEKNIKNKNEIIENFKFLSRKIGKEKMILRYDPIFLTEKYTIDYHCGAFKKLCSKLKGYTTKCVISFIDLYKKTERNTKELHIIKFDEDLIKEIAKKFVQIANEYEITIESCAEEIDLTKYGIEQGSCIDAKLVGSILGYEIDVKQDNQRKGCKCVKSVDIGQYNTCMHHCLYCYANFNYDEVKKSYKLHNPNSTVLSGEIHPEAKITDRKMDRLKPLIKKEIEVIPNANQIKLF